MSKEQRAELSNADINKLPDTAFAYIEPGGEKDSEGKTTPRKLRHYPIQDKPDADNALSRAEAQIQNDGTGKSIAEKALAKIKAAVNKFSESEEQKAATWNAEHRDEGPSYEDLREMLSSALTAAFAPTDDIYVYVNDFGDDWVVFSKNGEKQRCAYTLSENEVKFGTPEQVRPVTTYEALTESKSAPRIPVTPKRAFSSFVEQPPAHTVEAHIRMDDASGSTARFLGYASTTGTGYVVRDWLGEYEETIMPGAFAKTLRETGDVPLLFNHDGVPLASTGSGTSRLSEDNEGLRNEADLDCRDALTNSICVQLQRKVLSKMSFSFRAVKDGWNDSYDQRGVNEAALYDTSIVTYPANPATSGELVEAMRSALGREGRSLWLADHELSIRSALPALVEHRELPEETDDLAERALRALAHADEVVSRSKGPHGRARTFLVGQAMIELRAGKVLSTANQELLKTALTALSAADKQHQKMSAAHATATEAVTDALNSASGNNEGDPINPADGGGARSLTLKRTREAELRELRRL